MNTLERSERTRSQVQKQPEAAASASIRSIIGPVEPVEFFEQMVAAVEAYPENYVDLEIIDVVSPGDVLNVDETSTFRVKVTNRGPLSLTGVTLHVYGQNGATVANNGAIAPFVSDFITQEMPTIGAHGGSQLTVGSPLKFKAPGSPQASKTLVKATLEAWNANQDHIMNGHSDPVETVKGIYAAEVVGS